MVKNLTIVGRSFSSARLSDADFKNVTEAYVIKCVAQDCSFTVLDVGQSNPSREPNRRV
jgi:hypothetical protein